MFFLECFIYKILYSDSISEIQKYKLLESFTLLANMQERLFAEIKREVRSIYHGIKRSSLGVDVPDFIDMEYEIFTGTRYIVEFAPPYEFGQDEYPYYDCYVYVLNRESGECEEFIPQVFYESDIEIGIAEVITPRDVDSLAEEILRKAKEKDKYEYFVLGGYYDA